MFVKVAALRKLPVAVRVRALEGPITRVRALMDGEAADHAKGLVASWKVTFVGALIGMRTHVLRQGTCLAETLVTHGTYVRAVAGVCLNMTQYLLFLLELAAMLGTLAADPATFVFSLTRTDMHFGNMRRQLGMRIEAFCTMNPATGMLLFALFIEGTQTGRHNIVKQTLGLQRSPRPGICRRRC